MQPNLANSEIPSNTLSNCSQISNTSQSSLWRGREVHHSKSTFSIGLQVTMSAIMTLLGAVLLLALLHHSLLGLLGDVS